MAEFKDYDIKKLEWYWQNIKELERKEKYFKYLKDMEGIDPKKAKIFKPFSEATEKKYNRLKIIVAGIHRTYNSLYDDRMRTIVDMMYWDKANNFYQVEDVADKLNISVRQVHRIKLELLKITADFIGYV